jgi:transcriptional regulator with PAS, ATPase and Fis domain
VKVCRTGVCRSEARRSLLDFWPNSAQNWAPVMIVGETAVGAGILANSVHHKNMP